ncbi:MAG TPA: hypothetical protein VFM55_04770 [Micromonosporaceae bacterium]|nr:hypothetical protein [Micromonosporaceae bacterium]
MQSRDYDQNGPAGAGRRLAAGGAATTGRRRLLGAGAGAAVTALAGVPGCDLLRPDPTPTPSPDPLEPLLTGAVALVKRYEAVIARLPQLAGRLTPLRDAHLVHVSELAALIGRPPPVAGAPAPRTPTTGTTPPAPPTATGPDPATANPATAHPATADPATAHPATATPTTPGTAAVPGAIAELRGAEQAAQRTAAEACLAAPARRAGLLGAITACRATHVEVLR